MHRSAVHEGKVPEHFVDETPQEMKIDPTTDILELNAKLDEAISVEDYEEAARLRDSIAQLENPSSESEKDKGDAT